MKVSVEMTPRELREFLGFPDVKPLQDEMLERMREQMLAGVESTDPASLMRPFLAPNLETLESMQRAFWSAMGSAGAGSGEESGRKR